MPVVHVIDLYGMKFGEYLPVPEEVRYGWMSQNGSYSRPTFN